MDQPKQKKQRKVNRRKHIVLAMICGILLGLVCKYLPEPYQNVCGAVSTILKLLGGV